MPNAVEMRKVKENIEMGDKKSNAKGVSPHLFQTLQILSSATILTGMTELKMQSKAISAPIRYKGYWSFGQD